MLNTMIVLLTILLAGLMPFGEFVEFKSLSLAQRTKVNENRDRFNLQILGLTALEPPFIYHENGPYRGYCADVIKEISSIVGFKYMLRISPDGEIGTVKMHNGVYGELAGESADFAIGDITRENEFEANRIGVLYTKPILHSGLSVLISKKLLQKLTNIKKIKCENEKKKKGQVWCTEEVTYRDIFELPQVSRLVLQDSIVSRYYAQFEPILYKQMLGVEKASFLDSGIEKLRQQDYVLVDESKFTEYIADQNCHFEVINLNDQIKNELTNVKFDNADELKLREPRFNNEIVIALSAKQVDQYKKYWKKHLLVEFNHAIDQLEKSKRLQVLQKRHWRNKCRLLPEYANQASPQLQHQFHHKIVLISILSLLLINACNNALMLI